MKKLELLSNKYDYCKDITWKDVIKKIENEFESSTLKFLPSREYAPTFVLHNRYFPNTIQRAYDKVKESEGIDEMHIYTSLGGGSPTFGKHKDDVDVLIIQSVGRMVYVIENKEYLLNPGDGLVIPFGVYHSPSVIEPRITLSFSW